jgi:pantothenate kinase-related protein Tda10
LASKTIGDLYTDRTNLFDILRDIPNYRILPKQTRELIWALILGYLDRVEQHYNKPKPLDITGPASTGKSYTASLFNVQDTINEIRALIASYEQRH